MRYVFFSVFLLCVCVAAACRPSAAPVSISNRPTSINDRPTTNVPMPPSKPMAEMSWTDQDGTVHKLGDLKGKAVILDFWATNCPPCRQEIPHLNALLARHTDANLVVVGLHVGDEIDKGDIPKFTAETKLDYPIAFPENELIKFVFATEDAIPQTLVIDRNGEIVKKVVGFSDRIRLDLDAAVDTAIGGN